MSCFSDIFIHQKIHQKKPYQMTYNGVVLNGVIFKGAKKLFLFCSLSLCQNIKLIIYSSHQNDFILYASNVSSADTPRLITETPVLSSLVGYTLTDIHFLSPANTSTTLLSTKICSLITSSGSR